MKEEKDEVEVLESLPRKRPRKKSFKNTVNSLVLIFGGLYFCFHVGFVIWHAVNNQVWLLDQVRNHYAALIGLPFAAYAAVCLVLFLESRYDDPIEFKALGFEFKGASGPIVLWVICFLVISICMKLLWDA
jgi:hypothetical protein